MHEILGVHLLVDGFPLVFDLDASQGSWIVDARTGERYLDFFSFFASPTPTEQFLQSKSQALVTFTCNTRPRQIPWR